MIRRCERRPVRRNSPGGLARLKSLATIYRSRVSNGVTKRALAVYRSRTPALFGKMNEESVREGERDSGENAITQQLIFVSSSVNVSL